MASGDLRTYDPGSVFVSLAGIPISGWADGEFITIENDSDDFEDVVGTDGEVTRSKSNDNRATVTIKLMQSSASNDLLSALRLLDKNSSNGAGVGPFMLRDGSGRSLEIAEKAWIAKGPNRSFDKTAGSREWKIRCAAIISGVAGN